jgi:hypothetical protein
MTFTLDIDMTQVKNYAAIVKVAGERLIPEMDRAVNVTVNEGKRYISEKTPKIIGNLRRGFQVQRLAPMIWMIYNLVKYFPFIETGERTDKRWPGEIIYRRAGPAAMVKNSIQEIKDRLALNVDVALTYLLHWRMGA